MDEDDFERLKIRPCVSHPGSISGCPTDPSREKADVKWRRLRGLDSRYKCSRIIGSGSFGKVLLLCGIDALQCTKGVVRVSCDDQAEAGQRAQLGIYRCGRQLIRTPGAELQ